MAHKRIDAQKTSTRQPSLIINRTFNASPKAVFKAWTDPALMAQWWGPKYLTTRIDVLDARPGGMWRFVQNDQNGHEYAFHGVFHAITGPAECIIQTFEYEGTAGHVLLETIIFEDVDGKTRLIDQSVFQSVADRDAMLAENMEAGASESMTSLAALLAEMKEE
jgi:uncharacterized protein YndB with AHSA1/START domain